MIVYLVDMGYFHIIHRDNFKPITEAVTAFSKIFLAKCKLANIQARSDSNVSPEHRSRWKPEAQHFVGESLRKAAMDNAETELIICERESWRYEEGDRIPKCTAQLIINGVDFGEQLIGMGLAQRKSG